MRSGQALLKVASGQKLIIYGLLLNIAGVIVRLAVGNVPAWAMGAVAAVVALIGLFRLGSGMGYPIWWRVLFAVFLLIPLVALITLVILNSQATKALRAGGFKVGLLGVTGQATTG